jgi:hypothetical protein
MISLPRRSWEYAPAMERLRCQWVIACRTPGREARALVLQERIVRLTKLWLARRNAERGEA